MFLRFFLLKQKEKSLSVKHLLNAVINGDYQKVDKILYNNPLLLLEKQTIMDNFGNVYQNKTALQLAAGACDFNVFYKHKILKKGMFELIEKHFFRIPNKKVAEINLLIQQQFTEQFPEGYIASEIKKVNKCSEALRDVTRALMQASNDTCRKIVDAENKVFEIIYKERSSRSKDLRGMINSTLNATSVETFEAMFSKLHHFLIKQNILSKSTDIVLVNKLYFFKNLLQNSTSQSGKHFNHQLIIEAINGFVRYQTKMGNETSLKNQFYWQKIIGTLQRHVAACEFQYIKDKFSDDDKNKTSLYTDDIANWKILGLNCAFNYEGVKKSSSTDWEAKLLGKIFVKIMENKHHAIQVHLNSFEYLEERSKVSLGREFVR